MIAEVIRIIMENDVISINTIHNRTTWLTFADIARLKLTCRELNASITQYWKFNFARLDYRVYCGIIKHGLEFLNHTNNYKKVKRFLQIFGYVHGDVYPLSWKLKSNIQILHMEYGANPHRGLLLEELMYRYDETLSYNIDYILKHYPTDLNAIEPYILTHNICSSKSLVLVLLKNGLDCNYIYNGWGLLQMCGGSPNIVKELLKYPIKTEILERELLMMTTYIGMGFPVDLTKASIEFVRAEIQRRKKN